MARKETVSLAALHRSTARRLDVPGRVAPLDKRAAKMLARRQKKLLERDRRLAHSTPAEPHRVRIAARKARYARRFLPGDNQQDVRELVSVWAKFTATKPPG